MRSGLVAGYMLVVLSGIGAGAAAAQESAPGGAHVSGIVGGSLFDEHVGHAQAIAAGFRFNPMIGIEIGAERVPGLRFAETEDGSLALWVPVSSNRGRALLVLSNLTVTIPVKLFGFRPYVLGGGGMANLRQSIRFAVSGEVHGLSFDRSQNALAIVAGGGLEYPVWRRLAVGVDVRYLRLFTDPFDTVVPDRYAIPGAVDPVRIGTRLVYRF